MCELEHMLRYSHVAEPILISVCCNTSSTKGRISLGPYLPLTYRTNRLIDSVLKVWTGRVLLILMSRNTAALNPHGKEIKILEPIWSPASPTAPWKKRDGDLLNQQRTSAREAKRKYKILPNYGAWSPPGRDVWYYIGWRSIFHERGT